VQKYDRKMKAQFAIVTWRGPNKNLHCFITKIIKNNFSRFIISLLPPFITLPLKFIFLPSHSSAFYKLPPLHFSPLVLGFFHHIIHFLISTSMPNLSFSSIIHLLLLIRASRSSILLYFSSTFRSLLLPNYSISFNLLPQRPGPFYITFRFHKR